MYTFNLIIMKKIVTFYIFFLSITGFTQTGEVFYEVSSLKKDKLDNPMVIGVANEYESMNFVLNYNNMNSTFRLERSLPISKRWYNFAKILSETYDGFWFQNLFTKESLVNKEIDKTVYQVVYERMDNWELTEDTKLIEGYTCYKAVRKELNETSRLKKNKYLVYIAWYTPDIPAPFGPIGNGGLPGLILRLEKPNLLAFTAKKIVLNKKRKIEIPLPKDGKKINVKERDWLMRKARKVTVD